MGKEILGLLLGLALLVGVGAMVWFLWDWVITNAVRDALCEALVEELLREEYCS